MAVTHVKPSSRKHWLDFYRVNANDIAAIIKSEPALNFDGNGPEHNTKGIRLYALTRGVV